MKVNELPRGTEILLHEDAGKANPRFWEFAKRLRTISIPHVTFFCCSILRGNLGRRMPISATGEEAVICVG